MTLIGFRQLYQFPHSRAQGGVEGPPSEAPPSGPARPDAGREAPRARSERPAARRRPRAPGPDKMAVPSARRASSATARPWHNSGNGSPGTASSWGRSRPPSGGGLRVGSMMLRAPSGRPGMSGSWVPAQFRAITRSRPLVTVTSPGAQRSVRPEVGACTASPVIRFAHGRARRFRVSSHRPITRWASRSAEPQTQDRPPGCGRSRAATAT